MLSKEEVDEYETTEEAKVPRLHNDETQALQKFRREVQKIAARLEGVETKEEVKSTLDKGVMWAQRQSGLLAARTRSMQTPWTTVIELSRRE
jgi:hypothetical protein